MAKPANGCDHSYTHTCPRGYPRCSWCSSYRVDVKAPAITKRMFRPLPARSCAWVDHERGAGVLDNGTAFTIPRRAPVGVLLDALPAGVETVNLVGERPGDDAEGFHAWTDGPLREGWSVAGHYLRRLMFPILGYRAPDGHRVELQRAASWFGEGDYTHDDARAALALVAELVGERFGAHAMRVRPAATGQELYLRTVTDEGHECVPDDIAKLIRSTSGQGRIEFRPSRKTRAGKLAELHEYDGRLMYAALCRELPFGRVQHGRGDFAGDPYTRGRFCCTWRVPKDWAHVGLLPMKTGEAWRFPDEPGEIGYGWVDGVELHTARKHGWAVRVHEWLIWPEKGRPLDKWARQLVEAYEAVELRASAYGLPAIVVELARAGLRAIVLYGLGAFQGRPHYLSVTTPIDGAVIPDNAIGLRVDGDTVIYERPAANPMPGLVHPEWPAAVWARCRARMLDGPKSTGALHVPAGDVLAIHTDALYLTADPRWADDGAAGRLRHKHSFIGPWPRPKSDGELIQLLRELRAS